MPTIFHVAPNGARSTVASPRTAGDATVVLADNLGLPTGSKFAAIWRLVTGNWTLLCILDLTGTGTTLTITGTADGTTDRDMVVGDTVLFAPVRGTVVEIHFAINTLETALPTKAPLDSPPFTGIPTFGGSTSGTTGLRASATASGTLTLPAGTDTLATQGYVGTAIANLVDSAPEVLNTLAEIDAALNNDPDLAATLTTAIAGKQPLDATLTALAGVVTSADQLIYATGSDTFAMTALSVFGRSLIDDVDATAARTTLGLGSSATHPASDFQVAGNYLTALTGDVTASGPGSSAATLVAVNSNVGSFTNASITVDSKGRVTAAASGSSGGTGTVTSVGLSLPAILTVSGSPVTGSGTLSATLATQVAHTIFSGPTTGAAAAPTFRVLVAADIPDLSGIYLTGNQTITLSGDVTGSGSTTITTAIGAGKVTNAMLAGSIVASKLVGSDLTLTQGQITGLNSALDAKAPLVSPPLTGAPTAPTATAGTNTTQLATTAFVATAVANLINAAPTALDTLKELADAIGDDANFAGSVTTALAGKQPLDATLTALAGVMTAADQMIYATASDTFSSTALSAYGRSLIDDADAAAARTTLGLGSSATHPTTDYLLAASNLSDLADAPTARTSLGLGTMAVQAAGAVAVTGGSIAGITLGPHGGTRVTSNSGAFDLATGDWFFRTLDGTNGILTVANEQVGQIFSVELLQDGTGGRSVTPIPGVTWVTSGGTAPTVASGANQRTTLVFKRTGAGAYLGWVSGSNAAVTALAGAVEGVDYLSGASAKLPEHLSFAGAGTPTAGTDKADHHRIPYGATCVRIDLSTSTAPTGTFQVTWKRSSDGGSTFPDTVASVTVTSGNKDGTTTTFTNAALAAGDLLRVDIDSVNGAGGSWHTTLWFLSKNQ